jgi:hypothetical protein
MSKLSDTVEYGVRVARAEPTAFPRRPVGEQFLVAGRPVTCAHCAGERFDARQALLNTALLTALQLDWLDRSATALVCTGCTQIVFFAERPEAV